MSPGRNIYQHHRVGQNYIIKIRNNRSICGGSSHKCYWSNERPTPNFALLAGFRWRDGQPMASAAGLWQCRARSEWFAMAEGPRKGGLGALVPNV